MALDTLKSWHKRPISMRFGQSTIDLLDALVASTANEYWGNRIQNRTHAVELAVAAFAAAKKVKTAGLKKPASRRR